MFDSITLKVLGEAIEAGVLKESLNLGCCPLVLPPQDLSGEGSWLAVLPYSV